MLLTTCFHGNLLSSNIPTEQYSRVLDRCYWPLLELVENIPGVKVGVEFPVRSLQHLDSIDKSFIAKINELQEQGAVEFIGSGYTQAIQPLLPYEVNQANLQLGNEYYQEMFNRTPSVAYLNEQNISQSTANLYEEIGYKSIIMDFDASSLAGDYSQNDLYLPKIVQGSSVNVLWNSSIAFQRFQRFIYGLISFDEYIAYLAEHYAQGHNGALMLYGSDWEIFDYKPGDIDLSYKQTKVLFVSKIHRH